MPEPRRPARSAADLLASAEVATPGAVELLAIVPQAARIERALMRAVRLDVLPHLRAADEAELWASELVEVRGIDGLLMRADVLEILRSRARKLLADGSQAAERLCRANEVLVSHHAGSPPLVRLEEEVAWLAMVEDQPAGSIQARLEVALAALVRDRRVGVARWAARALPRLPEVARGTRAAWQLYLATANRVPGARRELGVRPPAGTAVVDLAAIAPHLGFVPLGVRRLGDRVELGAVGPGGVAIMVPASEPRFVIVSRPSQSTPAEVAVPAGSLQELDIGWETLLLRSAGGQQWDLPVLTQQEEQWLAGVTVRIQDAATPNAPRSSRWVATAMDSSGLFLTAAAPVAASKNSVQAWPAGRSRLEIYSGAGITAPEGLALLRIEPPSASPLPIAPEVPEGARVVSFGVDINGELSPVVGTWSDQPDHGTIVRARTRARAEGCLGAPIVVAGQLAGVVREVVEGDTASGSARQLVLRVTRQLDLGRSSSAATSARRSVGKATLTVELLPAGHGQAVLIGWGPPGDRRYLLVDGGPRATSKEIVSRVRAATNGRLELIVITHADADRIEGITQLLEAGVSVGDVWFNGPAQIARLADGAMAPSTAVRSLVAAIDRADGRVNTAFGGAPVMVERQGPLPRVRLSGGSVLTVLAPAPEHLMALGRAWRRQGDMLRATSAGEVGPDAISEEASAQERADDTAEEAQVASKTVVPADADRDATRERGFGSDRSVANGSSIVVLFELEGLSVLLTGDTHADTLLAAVRRLAAEQRRSRPFVDIFVLPHGGSRGNVTPELIESFSARTYAICTNGARFRHPDAETIALIAKFARKAMLVFNYRSESTARWADPAFAERYELQTRYPAPGDQGVVLSLESGRAPS